MKIHNFSLLALSFLLVSMSCDKEDGADNGNSTKEIQAKWNVIGTSRYQSFEFLETGAYLITESATANPPISGAYRIKGNTVTLSGFGKIIFSDLKSDPVIFTVILDTAPNDPIPLTLTKQGSVPQSSKTDLLCREWVLVREEWVDTNLWTGERDKGGHLYSEDEVWIISPNKSGTIISYEYNTDDGDWLNIDWGSWAWKNKNEDALFWEEEDGHSFEYKVLELTKDKLVLFEEWIAEGYSDGDWKHEITSTYKPYDSSLPKLASPTELRQPFAEKRGFPKAGKKFR